MNDASSKNLTSAAPAPGSDTVVLFPLCDARGDLSRVLRNAKHDPGTRADALIFAWLLDLPPTMPAASAARAVLAVANSKKRRPLTGRQKTMLRELRAIVAEGSPYRSRDGQGSSGVASARWDSVLPRWSAIKPADEQPESRLGKSDSR